MNKHLFSSKKSNEVEEITVSSSWRALHLFNAYRIILAIAFFIFAFYYNTETAFLGHYYRDVFFVTIWLYFCFSIASISTIHYRIPPFKIQVLEQILVDIVAITLVMHTSGGFGSGLAALLIVPVVGGSLLIEGHLKSEGRTAFFFAAIASLGVLIHVIFADIYSNYYPTTGNSYSQAGIFGIAFFSTAFLSYILARRAKVHAVLAEQRRIILHHIARLKKEIIPGILVIDAEGRLRFSNDSAHALLGWKPDMKLVQNGLLSLLSPKLSFYLDEWKSHGRLNKSFSFELTQINSEILATFTVLEQVGTLIVLEDNFRIKQRMFEIKLAALGRLTAAIAHDIRNPLSAISQAGQLLEEMPDLSDRQTRLIEIILRNCKRINDTIESVLQLGRGRNQIDNNTNEENITVVHLEEWLRDFVREFTAQKKLTQQTILTHVLYQSSEILFNPEQLYQVILNLCENGLRVALRKNPNCSPCLEFTIGFDGKTKRVYLDVCDHGSGMAETSVQRIFEPFFTTENKTTIENMGRGVGLGLFIAKEICDDNHAFLYLSSNTSEGCCFRINFSTYRQ